MEKVWREDDGGGSGLKVQIGRSLGEASLSEVPARPCASLLDVIAVSADDRVDDELDASLRVSF